MRKAMIISFLSVFFLVAKSEAQHFHFVNSIGTQHHWDLPNSVYNEIDHAYRGYDIIHAGNVWKNGLNYFDITLRRGNVFVRLEIGKRGRILSRNVSRSYPFNNHVCNNHCGFHNDFFVQNRVVCSTPYYNRYPNRPNSVVYVRPRSAYGQGNNWNSQQGQVKVKVREQRKANTVKVVIDNNKSRSSNSRSSVNSRKANTSSRTAAPSSQSQSSSRSRAN